MAQRPRAKTINFLASGSELNPLARQPTSKSLLAACGNTLAAFRFPSHLRAKENLKDFIAIPLELLWASEIEPRR